MAMKGVHKPQTNLARPTRQPSPGGDKCYDTSAHTDTHHGQGGSATGSPRDSAPMDYVRKTYAEGATSEPIAGRTDFAKTAITERGMHTQGPSHLVGSARMPATGAHGYGHSHGRGGVLRYSGHPGAHRVGKR